MVESRVGVRSTDRMELQGDFGMVASTHFLASTAGMQMLELGGNAFDAAAAAGFVLQVVQPHRNGPGGEVALALSDCRGPHPEVLCGQGVAPAAATIDRLLELGFDVIPGTGLVAACVPGAVGAWLTLLRDRGSLTLREVLDPAIGHACAGFPASPLLAASVAAIEPVFRSVWSSSADVYLCAGRPVAGGPFRNRALARTYETILGQAEAASGDRRVQCDAALDAFYRGFVAEAIDRFCVSGGALDSSGGRQVGLLVGDDLAGWVPSWETPVGFEFRGTVVHKPGPWSQGPVLLQQLAILAQFDLESMPRLGSRFVHTVVESAKLAFADRDAWYGDPLDIEVPIGALLDEQYGAGRARLVEEHASVASRPGSPDGCAPASLAEAIGGPPGPEGTEVVRHLGAACHVEVVDRFGNFVSAASSGGRLQSSPVVPGLGFPLGTAMQQFELDPHHPNRLLPFKRPRTTLSPSIASRDGFTVAAFGTSGGDEQDQWSLQLFLDAFLFGDDYQLAVDRPVFQTSCVRASCYPRRFGPSQVEVESQFGSDVLEELRERGHRVDRAGTWPPGGRSVVGRGGGSLRAGVSPRGAEGHVVGR